MRVSRNVAVLVIDLHLKSVAGFRPADGSHHACSSRINRRPLPRGKIYARMEMTASMPRNATMSIAADVNAASRNHDWEALSASFHCKGFDTNLLESVLLKSGLVPKFVQTLSEVAQSLRLQTAVGLPATVPCVPYGRVNRFKLKQTAIQLLVALINCHQLLLQLVDMLMKAVQPG